MPPGPMMKCRLAANSANDQHVGRRARARTASADERRSSERSATSAAAPSSRRASRPPMAARAARRRAHGACGLPSRPHGRDHQHDRHHDELGDQRELRERDDDAEHRTSPMPMQSALISPMSSAARNAPGIDAEAADDDHDERIGDDRRDPCSRLAGSRGSCSAPPSPASSAPSAEHAGKKPRLVDAERARSSRGPRVAARTSMPQRVRVSSSHSSGQHDRPEHDQQQVVLRNARGRGSSIAPRETRRARPEQILGAPDAERGVLARAARRRRSRAAAAARARA